MNRHALHRGRSKVAHSGPRWMRTVFLYRITALYVIVALTLIVTLLVIS